MQRDRNIPDLESFVESPMWMELTFITSILRMWWYGFSYNSVCLSLVMIYTELFIIKYAVEILNFIKNNETCNKIGDWCIAVQCCIDKRIVSVVDWYKRKKVELNEQLVRLFELTMGRPIMAPFKSWGFHNHDYNPDEEYNFGNESGNESDFKSDNESNNESSNESDDEGVNEGGNEEPHNDFGQAVQDTEDELEACDNCGVKDIDPNCLDDGELNLSEVGGGYAHEGCLSSEELKEYEKSVSAHENDDSNHVKPEDELEVKNDECCDENGYEVVNKSPVSTYNLRKRNKKSWSSMFLTF